MTQRNTGGTIRNEMDTEVGDGTPSLRCWAIRAAVFHPGENHLLPNQIAQRLQVHLPHSI